jgi:hypothetical protein
MKRPYKTAILSGLLVLLIAAGLTGGLTLSDYLEHRIADGLSTGLSEKLGTTASVRSVKVDLPARQVRLYGFRLNQPAGFGEEHLLYIPELEATVALRPMLSGEIRLTDIKLSNAQLSIVTDTNSTWNLKVLADQLNSGQPEDTSDGFFKEFCIEKISAADGTIHYFEPTKKNGDIRFFIPDLTADASNIRFSPTTPKPEESSGSLYITARVRKMPFPDARLGLAARFGAFGGTSPTPINCSLRLIGLELAIAEPILMANAAAVLGGDAVDIAVDLRRRADGPDGQILLKTIAGHRYQATVSGSLEEPSIQIADAALSLVLNRSGGVLGNMYDNLRSATSRAFKEGIETTGDIATGVSKSVGSFGEGFADAAKGIFTLDSSGISKGLTEMGTALTGGTKNALFTAGGGLIEGVGNVTGRLTGDEAACQWREDIPDRWEQVWNDARDTVKQDHLFR